MDFGVTKFGKSLIQKQHESCKNHELRQVMNYDKDEKECPYEIHIKCLKGHNIFETSANCCEDYELTEENFVWKLNIMRGIVLERLERLENS